jgi:hypothetical protein
MSGGLKETSDTDSTIFGVSKPKLSNMRELEPRTEALSKAKGGRTRYESHSVLFQPSLDWNVFPDTGRFLASPFHTRFSMILSKA